MKSSNKIKQKTPPWENPIFLMIMTFVGGYMNGYTYITRNNILANMHTANTSKPGKNTRIYILWNTGIYIPVAYIIYKLTQESITKVDELKIKCIQRSHI